MSLKVGQLTLIGPNNEEKAVKTSGKTFRIGSYLSCDLILNNPEAKKVHCEIQSDSFGRITITNHSKRNPVRVNDIPLKGTRPLYTGSIISIFDKKLKWVNKNRCPRNKWESDTISTPIMSRRRAEQAPNSEPALIMRKKAASKRITVHQFRTASTTSDDEMNVDHNNHDDEVGQDRLARASIISAARTIGATPPRFTTRNAKVLIRRTIDATHASPNVGCNKENSNADPTKQEEAKNLMLLKCQSSAMVVTSYSPTTTPKKTPKSFACVMSNKNTPKSDYGTPRSILSELNVEDLVESANHTPNTPTAVGSMHLIDFTTPDIYRTPMQKNTPLFKSALKNSIARTTSKAASNTDEEILKGSTVTPASNKKLRFDTSPSIKRAKQDTPIQRQNLSRNTPLRSSVTPKKLNISASSSQPKKTVGRLSMSASRTPASLTKQRILAPNSVKPTSSGISNLTPHIKRKSINISTPLKTPKAIFSDADKTCRTPVVTRHSCIKTPKSERKELTNSGSKSTPKPFSGLNRSTTFILDSPSVSKNKNTETMSNTSEISETILDKDDTLIYNETQDLNIMRDSPELELGDKCGEQSSVLLGEHIEVHGEHQTVSINQPENRRLKRSGDLDSFHNISRLSNTVTDGENDVDIGNVSVFHSLQEVDLSVSKPMNTTFEKEATIQGVQSPARRSTRNLSSKRLSLDATDANKCSSSFIASAEKCRKSHRLSVTTTKTDSIIETSNLCSMEASTSTFLKFSSEPAVSPSNILSNECEMKNLRRAKKINTTPKLYGIRELVKTPKATDDVNLIGVKELVNSPQVTGIDNVVGVKELFNTPAQNDLSNVVGVRELVKTPKPVKGLNDPIGMKELFNTPHRDELADLVGVKELVNTPKPGNNLNDLIGVKELFTAPKEITGLDDPRGMKELFNTPKANSGIENTRGVKELFNTPKPITGIDNVVGVKEMLNTPARDEFSDVRGVKELVNTPKVRSPQLTGVRELMKTPYAPSYEDADGFSEIFKTPASRAVMVLSTPNSVTVEKSTNLSVDLLKTPKEVDVLEGIEEVEEIYQSPMSNLILSETNCSSNQHLSPEESFDRLAGKPVIRRTYCRSSANPRVLSIPLAEDTRGGVTTDIQEWVDKVTCNIKDSVVEDEEVETATQSCGKICRKPLATSSSIKPTVRRSIRSSEDRMKQNDLHEMSGIEQFEDSIITASSISAVSLDVDAADSDSIVMNYRDSGKKKVRPSSRRLQSMEQQQPLGLSPLKVTPQIRRLRERVSSPYKFNSEKAASSKALYQDLSIQFIDESTVNVSEPTTNNTSRYKIRPSVNGTDVSLELIASHSKSTLHDKQDMTNSSVVDANESIEAEKTLNNTTTKLRKSRRGQSECVIFISDDERSLRSPSQVGGNLSADINNKTLEFVATNELSTATNNSARTMHADAFQSIVNASNAADASLLEASSNISVEYLSADASTLNSINMIDSASYEEEEEKLLELYNSQVSNGSEHRTQQSIEVVYVAPGSDGEDTVREDENPDESMMRVMALSPSMCKEVQQSSENSKVFQSRSSRRFSAQDSTKHSGVDFEKSYKSVLSQDDFDSEANATFGKTSSNEDDFSNFSENPLSGRRLRGRSEIPLQKVKSTSKTNLRKTGSYTSDSKPIDLEVEKRKNEFKNYESSPKIKLGRGASEMYVKLVRLSVSRRTTGKRPLNPCFDVQAEQDRRNLSLESANSNSAVSKCPARSRTMSLQRSKDTSVNERRTLGQDSIRDESLGHEVEHIVTFQEVSPSRRTFESPTQREAASTSRGKVCQTLSADVRDEDELNRPNMSLEVENCSAAEDQLDATRKSPQHNNSTNLVSSPCQAVSPNYPSADLSLDTQEMHQNLSLEFLNFKDQPAKPKTSRSRSERIDDLVTRSDRSRRTMGEQPFVEAFDLDTEIQQYRLEQEFQYFDPNGTNQKRRGRSQNFADENKVKSPAKRRLTVGQQPLHNSLDIEAERKRKVFEHFVLKPILKPIRGKSLSASDTATATHRTNKNRMTFGDPANTSFDLDKEKRKFLESSSSGSNAADSLDVMENNHEISLKDQIDQESHSLAPEKIRNYAISVQDEVINEEAIIDESLNTSRQQLQEVCSRNVSVVDKSFENTQDQKEHICEGSDVGNRRVHFGENVYYEVNKLDSQYFKVDDTPKARSRKKPVKQKSTKKLTKSDSHTNRQAIEDLAVENMTEDKPTAHNQEVINATEKVDQISEESSKPRRDRKAKGNINYADSPLISDEPQKPINIRRRRKIEVSSEKPTSENLPLVSTSNSETREGESESVFAADSEAITSAENPADETNNVAEKPTRHAAPRRQITSRIKRTRGSKKHTPVETKGGDCVSELPAQASGDDETAREANAKPVEVSEHPKNQIEAAKPRGRPRRGAKIDKVENTIEKNVGTEAELVESTLPEPRCGRNDAGSFENIKAVETVNKESLEITPTSKSRSRRAKANVAGKAVESEGVEDKTQSGKFSGKKEEIEPNHTHNGIKNLLEKVEVDVEENVNPSTRRAYRRRKANEVPPAFESGSQGNPVAVAIEENLTLDVNEGKRTRNNAAPQPEISSNTQSGSGKNPTPVDPSMETILQEKVTEYKAKKRGKRAISVSAEELPMVDAKAKEEKIENETKPVKRSRRLVSNTEEALSAETTSRNKSTRSKSKVQDDNVVTSHAQQNRETLVNNDDVFKTPLEVKPRTRRGRLLSSETAVVTDAVDAPARRTRRLVSLEQSAEMVSKETVNAPARRTRRLVSLEQSAEMASKETVNELKSDENTPNENAKPASRSRRKRNNVSDDMTPIQESGLAIGKKAHNEEEKQPPKPKRGKKAALLSESSSNIQTPAEAIAIAIDEVQVVEKIKITRARKRNEVEFTTEAVSSPQIIPAEKTATVTSSRTRTRRK